MLNLHVQFLMVLMIFLKKQEDVLAKKSEYQSRLENFSTLVLGLPVQEVDLSLLIPEMPVTPLVALQNLCWAIPHLLNGIRMMVIPGYG